jgi:hypothetical protein
MNANTNVQPERACQIDDQGRRYQIVWCSPALAHKLYFDDHGKPCHIHPLSEPEPPALRRRKSLLNRVKTGLSSTFRRKPVNNLNMMKKKKTEKPLLSPTTRRRRPPSGFFIASPAAKSPRPPPPLPPAPPPPLEDYSDDPTRKRDSIYLEPDEKRHNLRVVGYRANEQVWTWEDTETGALYESEPGRKHHTLWKVEHTNDEGVRESIDAWIEEDDEGDRWYVTKGGPEPADNEDFGDGLYRVKMSWRSVD